MRHWAAADAVRRGARATAARGSMAERAAPTNEAGEGTFVAMRRAHRGIPAATPPGPCRTRQLAKERITGLLGHCLTSRLAAFYSCSAPAFAARTDKHSQPVRRHPTPQAVADPGSLLSSVTSCYLILVLQERIIFFENTVTAGLLRPS